MLVQVFVLYKCLLMRIVWCFECIEWCLNAVTNATAKIVLYKCLLSRIVRCFECIEWCLNAFINATAIAWCYNASTTTVCRTVRYTHVAFDTCKSVDVRQPAWHARTTHKSQCRIAIHTRVATLHPHVCVRCPIHRTDTPFSVCI